MYKYMYVYMHVLIVLCVPTTCAYIVCQVYLFEFLHTFIQRVFYGTVLYFVFKVLGQCVRLTILWIVGNTRNLAVFTVVTSDRSKYCLHCTHTHTHTHSYMHTYTNTLF